MTSEEYPPPDGMPDDVAAVWREIVAAHTAVGDDTIARKVGPGLEAYCAITADLRAATVTVSEHGRLIQDARGTPVENPAIGIKNNAARELARIGDRYQPRPARPRRGRTSARPTMQELHESEDD